MSGPTNASATVIFANLARPLLVSFRAPAFSFHGFRYVPYSFAAISRRFCHLPFSYRKNDRGVPPGVPKWKSTRLMILRHGPDASISLATAATLALWAKSIAFAERRRAVAGLGKCLCGTLTKAG